MITELFLFADPTLFAAACALLGLLVGSFLNVVIHRLPLMMENEWRQQCHELSGAPVAAVKPFNLATPRSRCPHCGHTLSARENIPILSWLVLRGRCAACATPIPLRYPLIEAASGVLSLLAALHFGPGMHAMAALVLIWALIALAMIDLDTQLLPDAITLPLLWAGLLFNLNDTFVSLHSAVIGAAAGYLSLWCVYWAFRLATGKEGMGYGDFKLLAALGAWFGWMMLPLIVLLSSAVGAVVGITLILFARHRRETPIPFGPYLAAAGLIALFGGTQLTQLWLTLL
ncbi:prepilin peptidase [Rhodocyclus gracilis]|uniref:Prepilin leader peptidase/N-methyltransferase n=1 Tax=Rhodocyclus tenuis TaxID=1066 RepID=A0A6L5JTC8_RHOTE|nr:A24 family peptidase [Rhodocyclus gracilis]MQY50657.1 prepilin peptidase [Rhodocyclus gracilis]